VQGTPCQAPLSGDDPKPWRHQVRALPPIKPVVTAEQGPQLACPACGEPTRAPWPEGRPSGPYGPRGPATGALWTGAYRLSTRTPPQGMDAVCGVPWSVGTSSPLEPAPPAAVAAPVEAARPAGHAQAVAHLDETRGRHGGKRAGLGGAVTSVGTVFVGRRSRGSQGWPVRGWVHGCQASWGRLVTGRTTGIRYGGLRGAGRLGDAISQRGAAGVGAPRRWATPGWRRRTRWFPGGLGGARAPGNARLFVPLCPRFAERASAGWKWAAGVGYPSPPGHAETS
jgi:hypothetical protein